MKYTITIEVRDGKWVQSESDTSDCAKNPTERDRDAQRIAELLVCSACGLASDVPPLWKIFLEICKTKQTLKLSPEN